MLGGTHAFLHTTLFMCVMLVAYNAYNCAGSKSFTSNGMDNQLGLNHYEQINGSIEFIGTSHLRKKRSFYIYTCHRKSCDDNGCKPESYRGPHPPKWCQRNPYQKQTKCSWTESCMNSRCETQSTSCRNEFQELSNGRLQPKSTFSFTCYAREKICEVVECKGIYNCGETVTITMTQFENEFLKALPRCDEVDGKKGRRGRETMVASLDYNDIVSRSARAPISVANLQGYCCEVGERWKGVQIAYVRPRLG